MPEFNLHSALSRLRFHVVLVTTRSLVHTSILWQEQDKEHEYGHLTPSQLAVYQPMHVSTLCQEYKPVPLTPSTAGESTDQCLRSNMS